MLVLILNLSSDQTSWWQNREALVIKRYKHKCIQTIEMSLCSNKSIHETSKHMMPCTKLLRPIQQIETNYITWPLNEIPLSLSTGIIGGAYGGTLGRAAKWVDLAEGSLTLSWETNTKVIDEHSVIEETGTQQIRRTKILQQDIHVYTPLSSKDYRRRKKFCQ